MHSFCNGRIPRFLLGNILEQFYFHLLKSHIPNCHVLITAAKPGRRDIGVREMAAGGENK